MWCEKSQNIETVMRFISRSLLGPRVMSIFVSGWQMYKESSALDGDATRRDRYMNATDIVRLCQREMSEFPNVVGALFWSPELSTSRVTIKPIQYQ